MSARSCEVCGESLDGRRSHARFCSPRCQKRMGRPAPGDRRCVRCGEPVTGQRGAIYCSRRCGRITHRALQRAATKVSQRCEWCEAPMPDRRSDARCCSEACKANARYARDRERAKVDPVFAEVLRVRGRKTAAEWARRHPERAREKRARRTDYNGRRRALMRDAFVEDVDRFRVWFLGAGRCGICAAPVPFDGMHVDHVTPLVKGGEHSYANVQPAHPVCNLRKNMHG